MKQNSGGAREWHFYFRYSLERGPALLAFFRSLRAAQAFHLVLVDLDFARFFHLVAQVRYEKPEKLLLFTLKERVANLILLGGKILRRRLLLLQQSQDSAGVAILNRTANLAGLHTEHDRGRP